MLQIINLEINNITSVHRFFHNVFPKFEISVLDSKDALIKSNTKVLVLPGVGNFGVAANALNKIDIREKILDFVSEGGYVIGICLGMQLLGDSSEESPGCIGLGLIKGECRKLLSNKIRFSNNIPGCGNGVPQQIYIKIFSWDKGTS